MICDVDNMTCLRTFLYRSSPLSLICLLITKLTLVFLLDACGMYKYNSNFGAGCPNWAVWADLRFGFVHSTDILQKNYDVFCDQETQLLHW